MQCDDVPPRFVLIRCAKCDDLWPDSHYETTFPINPVTLPGIGFVSMITGDASMRIFLLLMKLVFFEKIYFAP